MRQKILAIPNVYTRKLLRKEDALEVRTILEEMIHRLLNDIKDLPNKAIDPHWMEQLEEEEDK